MITPKLSTWYRERNLTLIAIQILVSLQLNISIVFEKNETRVHRRSI